MISFSKILLGGDIILNFINFRDATEVYDNTQKVPQGSSKYFLQLKNN